MVSVYLINSRLVVPSVSTGTSLQIPCAVDSQLFFRSNKEHRALIYEY